MISSSPALKTSSFSFVSSFFTIFLYSAHNAFPSGSSHFLIVGILSKLTAFIPLQSSSRSRDCKMFSIISASAEKKSTYFSSVSEPPAISMASSYSASISRSALSVFAIKLFVISRFESPKTSFTS